MKLSTLLETVEDLINTISTKNHISPDEIRNIINNYSVSPKYSQFVIRQWAKNNIRLPEDGPRIKETLTNFHSVKPRLPNKDLLSYKTINDLENAIDPLIGSVSKREGGLTIDPLSLHGVTLYKTLGPYRSFKISDEYSLEQLGEGTKWCTRGSYERCQASHYINEYNWIGQIWHTNTPIIQFTSNLDQVMDRSDNEIVIPEELRELIPLSDSSSPDKLINYAINVIGGKSEKIEQLVLQRANKENDNSYLITAMVDYATKILRSRWPEAEPIILESDHESYKYARDIIKGRWPEAEPVILDGLHNIVNYARNVIKGRWPEAERKLLSLSVSSKSALGWPLAYAVTYAEEIMHGRWQEAEPIIMKEPRAAVLYATKILHGRWPEAEEYIMHDSTSAYEYAVNILHRSWPEAERVISQNSYIWLKYKNKFGH
jgi:hypothetical protein